MFVVRVVFSFVLLALLAGCSVHPLPKDVSRNDTFDIVKNMRCEAKSKVIERIRTLLREGAESPIVQNIKPEEVLYRKNIELIQKDYRDRINKILENNNYQRKWSVEKQVKDVLNIAKIVTAFSVMAITYEFDFEITENSDTRGNAAFRLPFVGGIANFGAGGTLGSSLTKTRVGKRTFTMGESFGELRDLKCGPNVFLQDGEEHPPLRKRFIYPLTGSIGMGEIMDQFLKLSVLGGGAGSFSDVITFTTVAAAGISADVSLEPGPLKKFRLAQAGASANASRTDIHQVTISLAWPDLRRIFDLAKIEELQQQTARRAAIEQCVQHGETRENRSVPGIRNVAPEQYCPAYIDQIFKKSGQGEKKNNSKAKKAKAGKKSARNFGNPAGNF